MRTEQRRRSHSRSSTRVGRAWWVLPTGVGHRQALTGRRGSHVAVFCLLVISLPAGLGCDRGPARSGKRGSGARADGAHSREVEERYPSGALALRRQVLVYPDGDMTNHGRLTRWYENGCKSVEMEYEYGSKHGRSAAWHENGAKAAEAAFRRAKLHGKYTKWYPTGGKKEESWWENGKRCGRSVRWRENGVRSLECTYVNGKPHGTLTLWNEDGMKTLEDRYENGVLVSSQIYLAGKPASREDLRELEALYLGPSAEEGNPGDIRHDDEKE